MTQTAEQTAWGDPPVGNVRWVGLAGFILLCLLVGGLSGLITADAVDTWYPTLDKPGFTPPSWLFAPVWTTLYVLMGVAAWRIWDLFGFREGQDELGLFAIQLGLNGIWSILFFGLRSPAMALADILALVGVLAATAWVFHKRDKVAGWLLVPYLAWVLYATALNAGIWVLN